MDVCKQYHLSVSISKIKPCKYHPDPNHVYFEKTIIPDKFCPDAFYSAYPYCLMLLYDGRDSESIKKNDHCIRKCPGVSNSVVFKISRKEMLPLPFKSMKKQVEHIISENIIPVDFITCKLEIKILYVKGTCQYSLKKGNKFLFNINNTSIMCPAGFAAIFPYVRSNEESKIPDIFDISCPDKFNIIYKIKNESMPKN